MEIYKTSGYPVSKTKIKETDIIPLIRSVESWPMSACCRSWRFLTADILQRHNIWIEPADHASKQRKFLLEALLVRMRLGVHSGIGKHLYRIDNMWSSKYLYVAVKSIGLK
jgi:hypothetical protein